MGLVLGLFLKTVSEFPSTLLQIHVADRFFSLSEETFFLYLLPPVVFEAGKSENWVFAGYFMPNRQLVENVVSILLFAIVGTIWNIIAIGLLVFEENVLGLALLLCSHFHFFSTTFNTFEILVFATLIADIDPVSHKSIRKVFTLQ